MELLYGVGLMVVVEHISEKLEVTTHVMVLSNLVDDIVVAELLVKDMRRGENFDEIMSSA